MYAMRAEAGIELSFSLSALSPSVLSPVLPFPDLPWFFLGASRFLLKYDLPNFQTIGHVTI